MANGKLSRAHVGLALASALVVLLASGVVISRMTGPDRERPVATGPSSTSSSLPGLGQGGSAVGSGPGSPGGAAAPAGAGAPAEQAAPVSDEAASAEWPITHRLPRTSRRTTGEAPASSAAAATGPSTGGSPGSPAGSGAPGASPNGASPGGGQESPPAPSQQPPEALAAASVSAGEGAQGAVVGIGFNGGPDVDLTVGTDQVIGDHPPSEGTGVALGGRLLPG